MIICGYSRFLCLASLSHSNIVTETNQIWSCVHIADTLGVELSLTGPLFRLWVMLMAKSETLFPLGES